MPSRQHDPRRRLRLRICSQRDFRSVCDDLQPKLSPVQHTAALARRQQFLPELRLRGDLCIRKWPRHIGSVSFERARCCSAHLADRSSTSPPSMPRSYSWNNTLAYPSSSYNSPIPGVISGCATVSSSALFTNTVQGIAGHNLSPYSTYGQVR